MRRNFPTIFVILMLIILIWCSACVSQSPFNQNSQNTGGIAQVSATGTLPSISFEEAKADLIAYRLNSAIKPINATSVYYMRSRDVDESGNATGWIFGVSDGPEPEFLVYDRTGWTRIGNVTLPKEEILLDSVVSPNHLFKQNIDMIARNQYPAIPVRRDIELRQGIYKLTITSGNTSRSLSFNATTGAIISV